MSFLVTRSYTMEDYASEISEISGNKIPYVDLSEGEYSNALVEAGLPEGLAGFLAGTTLPPPGKRFV
ncbi:MAG: hypothetical protein R2784_20540 [Saprospiraceae bacterium]